MKRNLVTLLGIAFVVAIVATGIFYGLFVGQLRDASTKAAQRQIVVASRDLPRGTVLKEVDLQTVSRAVIEVPQGAYASSDQLIGKTVFVPVQAKEPLTQARIASDKSAGGVEIPKGMRAVSVKVHDSSGVLALLRSGHRVDVQVLVQRPGGDPELRAMLQNMEVFTVDNPEGNQGRGAAPVVTLLATPAESDRLALADSSAKIRFLLRNPLDSEQGSRGSVSVASLMSPYTPAPYASQTQRAAASSPAQPAAETGRVQFEVRVVEIGQKAVEELSRRASTDSSGGSIRILALPSGKGTDEALNAILEQGGSAVLSTSRLTTGSNREVSHHAGGRNGSVHIRFLPTIKGPGSLRLKLRPEVTSLGERSVASRRLETEVDLLDGQSMVVMGLEEPGEASFAAGRQMVVLIKPQVLAPTVSASLAAPPR